MIYNYFFGERCTSGRDSFFFRATYLIGSGTGLLLAIASLFPLFSLFAGYYNFSSCCFFSPSFLL